MSGKVALATPDRRLRRNVIFKYIPKRISELCRKRGYSKYRLSQLTGMSQTALGNIMSRDSIPTISTLEKICDAFGISLAQFFAGDSGKLDLTSDQTELLDIWDGLEVKEREIVLSLMRSLKK